MLVPIGEIFTFCGILDPVTHTYTLRSAIWSRCGFANASVVATASINSTAPAFASFDVFIIWNLETLFLSIVILFNPEDKGEFRRRLHGGYFPKIRTQRTLYRRAYKQKRQRPEPLPLCQTAFLQCLELLDQSGIPEPSQVIVEAARIVDGIA